MALGTRPFDRRDVLRFAFTSGGTEALVALLGALAGEHIISRFSAIDHWIAFILLAGVSLHMFYEGIKEIFSKNEIEDKTDFHSFTKILIVSLATSLDAFGVGISLGIRKDPILPFIASIGFWAFVGTIVGLYLARHLSKKYGSIMSFLGAIVLMVLAFQMLKI